MRQQGAAQQRNPLVALYLIRWHFTAVIRQIIVHVDNYRHRSRICSTIALFFFGLLVFYKMALPDIKPKQMTGFWQGLTLLIRNQQFYEGVGTVAVHR